LTTTTNAGELLAISIAMRMRRCDVGCGAHFPMGHILGFTQSHWMLPLAGIVADMSATCRPNSQMLAHFADMPLLWRHKIDPNTTFLCRGWPTFTPFFFLSTRGKY
jgi:hypothetical protein